MGRGADGVGVTLSVSEKRVGLNGINNTVGVEVRATSSFYNEFPCIETRNTQA